MSTPTPTPNPAPAAAAPAAPAAGEPQAPGPQGTPAPPTGADATAAAEQMLAAAIAAARQQPEPAATPTGQTPPAPAGEPEVTDWEAEATKWKALSRKHEERQLAALGLKSADELQGLRDAAAKYQELQDAQKTELERATEQAATVAQQLAEQQAINARLMAAATHSIPPDLIDLLGTGTDEEINARAAILAERLKAAVPPAAAPAPSPAPQRPVEALTPGAAPASTAPADPDAWIRRLTGRTP